MNTGTFTIRHATERDQSAITALVYSERLNPIDLDWRRFVIASDHTGVLGAVQLREHDDRSRELGSLVVRNDARGRGIAARLIDALLAPVATRVLMITGARFAHHYARWGFARIEPETAPTSILRNYYFGRIVGWVLSFFSGRPPKMLAVLQRSGPVR
jgi:N-acetylglutamate synthase-like GNAT family acetyltransferase